eukprot:6213963-Karenia_brevis.AAC.1
MDSSRQWQDKTPKTTTWTIASTQPQTKRKSKPQPPPEHHLLRATAHMRIASRPDCCPTSAHLLLLCF